MMESTKGLGTNSSRAICVLSRFRGFGGREFRPIPSGIAFIITQSKKINGSMKRKATALQYP